MKRVLSGLSEHEEQVIFVNWFEIQFRDVRIFAIPNGTRTTMGSAIKAKKEGVRKGVPDLFIPEWLLWIEFKREKGGTVSSDQKDWHEYLSGKCRQTVIVAKGFRDGREKVLQFLGNRSNAT